MRSISLYISLPLLFLGCNQDVKNQPIHDMPSDQGITPEIQDDGTDDLPGYVVLDERPDDDDPVELWTDVTLVEGAALDDVTGEELVQRALEIARKIDYVELCIYPGFQRIYARAMQLGG